MVKAVYEDNKKFYYIVGIDLGGLAEVIEESERYALCKIKGHTAWAAVGTFKYYHPEYIVLDKEGKDMGAIVKEFEYTRKTGKAVKDVAIKFYRGLIQ